MGRIRDSLPTVAWLKLPEKKWYLSLPWCLQQVPVARFLNINSLKCKFLVPSFESLKQATLKSYLLCVLPFTLWLTFFKIKRPLFRWEFAKLCNSSDMSLHHRHCLYYCYYHLRYNQYLHYHLLVRRWKKWLTILLRLFCLVECTQLSFVRIKTHLQRKKRIKIEEICYNNGLRESTPFFFVFRF